jgi:hypothetical protein
MLRCMKATTIRLDEQLLKDAQRAAAESGQTFTDLVADALRERLARRKANANAKREPVILHTFTGNGLQPGVDLHDSAGLLDLMDEHDAASRR